MTSPTPTEPVPTSTCCGEGGPETPGAGKPRVVACQLCPNAGTAYWRTNRSDGRPYELVKPLGEADGQ